jgi:transposase
MNNGSRVVKQQEHLTVGLDVGDKYSQLCVLDGAAEVLEEARIRTTPDALRRRFEALDPSLVALEVGAHSPWVSRVLEDLGHECLVANPAALYRKGQKKNDKLDAERLARWRAPTPRCCVPSDTPARTCRRTWRCFTRGTRWWGPGPKLINTARGLVKAYGARLPDCDARSFARKVKDAVPLALRAAIEPLLRSVEQLSEEIHFLDGHVEALADQKYAQTAAMRQITGVGALTSVAFALVLRDPYRFRRSRQVGPYLGLTRRENKSGESDPELHISKAGNEYLRQLLVGSAHYILGPFGPECDLRRWGLHKAQGGKNAKKRAVVAVARKLAVLMHRLWLTGEVYEPLRQEEVMPAPPTA